MLWGLLTHSVTYSWVQTAYLKCLDENVIPLESMGVMHLHLIILAWGNCDQAHGWLNLQPS